ncbi:MAG: ATP-dependent helicase HrpB, partial [Pseudomonadota bacterium]
ILIRPLYGNLSLDEQVAAITPDPDGKRRVVLATDIAETSLTIEGVTTVVDSGWTREPRFDPNTGLTRLVDRRVSRASARQRCGRAGRLGPGTCYRLWTETQHQGLEAGRTPEILVSDLAPLALELALWGIGDPARLRWINTPPDAAWTQAVEQLQQLDALDTRGRITAVGRRMAALPVHPRLAHLLVQADALGLARLGADIAALLSERDPIPARAGALRPVDIEQRLHLLKSWRDRDGRIKSPDVDNGALRGIDRASRQYRRLLKQNSATQDPLSPGALLALAFPERVAQARDHHSGRYRLANGRGAKLPEGDTLVGTPYLVAAHLDAGHADGRIFLAAPLHAQELRDLLSEHIEHAARIRWDDKAGRVAATQRETFGHLVLAQRPLENADPDQVRSALLSGIRSRGIAVLPWTKAARRLQQRLLSVRSWQPDAGWPDLSNQALSDSLEDWLSAWIGGLWRLDQLAHLNLVEILLSRLDWPARQRLDTLAPDRLRVPSGSRKALEYHVGEPPVLAVRLQEMFGLTQTPRVCNGQVAVTLHLLSPAGRPIQVTRDLESFWR